VLKKKGYNTAVAMRALCSITQVKRRSHRTDPRAIEAAGYKPASRLPRADPASSEFYDTEKKKYVFKKDKSELTSERMVSFYDNWVRSIPSSPLRTAARKTGRWRILTDKSAAASTRRDEFSAPTPSLQRGIEEAAIHPHQGQPDRTLTETLEATSSAALCYTSHVASLGRKRRHLHPDLPSPPVGRIKTGSVSPLTASQKYKPVLRIEKELGSGAVSRAGSLNYEG